MNTLTWLMFVLVVGGMLLGGSALAYGMLQRRRLVSELSSAGGDWAAILGLASTGQPPHLFAANVAQGAGFSPTPRLVAFDSEALAVVSFGLTGRRQRTWSRSNAPSMTRRRAPIASVMVDSEILVVDGAGFLGQLREAGWLREV